MQDSKAIRVVDRYVGSVSCRLLSWVFRPTKRRLSPFYPASHSLEKVLLIELFEMGAAVMLVPSLNYIKVKNPRCAIHVLTTSSCAPAWNALGLLQKENIHCIDSSSLVRFGFSALKNLLTLRKIKFDLILDFQLFMRISVIFSGLLKGISRAGFYKYDFEGLYRGDFYQTKCGYNQNSHISKNYLALTKTAIEMPQAAPNYKNSISPAELVVPAKSKSEAKTKFAFPYIAICADVGPTLAVRNYPREYFSKVVNSLATTYPDYKFVFVGTEKDRSTSQAILENVKDKDRCVDLCGKTTFDDLLQVIGEAKLLITNDNGPGHFAALEGTKTLALFSTDSPFVYGPLGETVIAYSFFQCSPCISAYNHKKSRCDNNVCLQALAPSKVVELARSILDGKAKFRTINNEIPYLL